MKITLEQVKDHLNLKGVSHWDSLLNGYIEAAFSKVKQDCICDYDSISTDNDKINIFIQCQRILVGDMFTFRDSSSDTSHKSPVAYDVIVDTIRTTTSG